MKPKNKLTLNEITKVFYEKDSKLYWKNNKLAGYKRNDDYIHIKYKNCCFYAHRLLYQIYNNLEEIPEGFLVDHKDRDRTNNSKENLRLATYSENNYNRKINNNNALKIKNISIKNSNGVLYYILRIKNKDWRIFKYFPYTEEGLIDCIKEKDILIRNMHGDFSNL